MHTVSKDHLQPFISNFVHTSGLKLVFKTTATTPGTLAPARLLRQHLPWPAPEENAGFVDGKHGISLGIVQQSWDFMGFNVISWDSLVAISGL